MSPSRRTGRSRLTLALLILTSLAVLTLDFRDASIVQSARRVASSAFSPLRGVAETATRPLTNAWDGITGYGDLEDENARLRERIDELEGDRVRNEDAVEQLDVLLEQLDIDWVGDIPTAVAKVTSGPDSNFSRTIRIDKGSRHGLAVGMPVVTGAGLAGKIVQVTENQAAVMLITDPEFAVGVRITADGTQGTARGHGEGNDLVADMRIPGDATVRTGASLTTSGIDTSPFPASIPVGRVAEARPGRGGLTLDLVVEPMVDTSKISYLTVLLREPPG